MKLGHIVLGGAFALLTVVVGCGPREQVIARVGGEKITVQDFKDEFLHRFRTEDNAQRQPYQMREKVLREMATDLALYQEGVALGLDQKPEAKNDVEQVARRKALEMLYQQQIVDKIITDAAARKF